MTELEETLELITAVVNTQEQDTAARQRDDGSARIPELEESAVIIADERA